jgi:CheY-like chemotaxis protein
MDADLKDKGILVVDDEDAFSSLLRAALEGEGYTQVYIANDGLKCLSLLEQMGDKIYVILLDLKMPRMDGLEMMRHLVNVHKPIVGIVVITGYASAESEKMFEALGTSNIIASRYMRKPVQLRPLLHEVQKTLSLVHVKRCAQADMVASQIIGRLSVIENDIEELKQHVVNLSQKVPGFTAQLGMDVLRAVLIGFLVIASLYFGVGDFLAKIFQKLR